MELDPNTLTPEELRAWSVWLAKVAETAADEWQEWLLAHINLALRLNECLLKAKREIELEELQPQTEESTADDDERAEEAMGDLEKSDATTEATENEKMQVSYNYEETEDKVVSDKELETQEPNNSSSSSRIEKTHENVEQKEAEDKNTESVVSIGIVPAVGETSVDGSQQRQHQSSQEKEAEKIIPIPRDESEMLQIIKEFRRRAKKYQSLYEYWLGTADRVIQGIAGKSAAMLLAEQVFADIEIESDDEEMPSSDPARERITCNNLHLFFNLTDESDQIENSPG